MSSKRRMVLDLPIFYKLFKNIERAVFFGVLEGKAVFLRRVVYNHNFEKILIINKLNLPCWFFWYLLRRKVVCAISALTWAVRHEPLLLKYYFSLKVTLFDLRAKRSAFLGFLIYVFKMLFYISIGFKFDMIFWAFCWFLAINFMPLKFPFHMKQSAAQYVFRQFGRAFDFFWPMHCCDVVFNIFFSVLAGMPTDRT